MYRTLKHVNWPAIEEEIMKQWEKDNTFTKSIELRPESKRFVFYEGPPSANGMPGIHHVMARAIKDVFCRYKTLQGYRVDRKGGWDTHGLPIELQVEKRLGITKEDIGKSISVEQIVSAIKTQNSVLSSNQAANYHLPASVTINGATVVTDTVGTIPTVTTQYLGHDYLVTNHLNSTISKTIIYPSRVINSNLQVLSR